MRAKEPVKRAMVELEADGAPNTCTRRARATRASVPMSVAESVRLMDLRERSVQQAT
jgi:hypothetical protein